jgi:hypothetical protein
MDYQEMFNLADHGELTLNEMVTAISAALVAKLNAE